MSSKKLLACDIFCTVVDNYGDIGVCWRLSRQLVIEHGLAVRLWVDDLPSLRKLCPQIISGLDVQHMHGVEIRRWPVPDINVKPAQLVIEGFACELPQHVVQAMAVLEHKPLWLNLEYLSAEDWVAGCHGLSSPHPYLPLVKYFFFPGFTNDTGGLLLEGDLLARRDAFLAGTTAQDQYWNKLHVPQRIAGELRVSLFCYENPATADLFAVWVHGEQLTTCLIPEGLLLPQVASFFGRSQLVAGDVMQQGNLRVHVLPFVEQDEYDKLLWACDVNFVRGEDSFVRAQWAAKPFIWHIYSQHDGVHMKKLHAFMDLYCRGLEPESAQAVRDLWGGWNAGVPAASPGAGHVWKQFVLRLPLLLQHTEAWAQKLAPNNLTLNLLDFPHKVGKIATFQI